MKILNCDLSDLNAILDLYNQAIAFQKTKNCAVWPVFDAEDVLQAITEQRQFKISIDGSMAGVFTYTFNDKAIWEEKDKNDALYIHKIATSAKFKGQHLVKEIIDFSKIYALSKSKTFLRMDTVGDNKGLIAYYTQFGFNYLGLHQLKNYADLPLHYHRAAVSLFELAL